MSKTGPNIDKMLLAANRHLLGALERSNSALFFECDSLTETHPPAVMRAREEALHAVRQLGLILDRLGVGTLCEKCRGSGESVGMTHRQPCEHCKEGLIYQAKE